MCPSTEVTPNFTDNHGQKLLGRADYVSRETRFYTLKTTLGL